MKQHKFEELSKKVIGLSLEVHKELGPGLLESTYQQCLAYELSKNKISFEMEKKLPVHYKELKLDCGYRLDLLIDNTIIVEIKSVEKRQMLSKEVKEELKNSGLMDEKGKLKIKGVSPKMLKKMKQEFVDCPVLKKDVQFIPCFVCPNFQSRVTGKVLCKGDNLN